MSLTSSASLIRPLATVLARDPAVELAIVFGSVARGSARFDSDLDIAVLANGPLEPDHTMQLIGDLAKASGRPVDLVDLHTVGEPLLGQILKHGKRICGTDAVMADLMRRHVFDTEDFVPYLARMLDERNAAWIG